MIPIFEEELKISIFSLHRKQMMAANENEDPDVEFPIKDGKDPAVHARPAFGDPDKYEETTSGPREESTVNQVRLVAFCGTLRARESRGLNVLGCRQSLPSPW